ncbi:MAG: hypothetical protein O7F71_16080 [Gammaproteobacteria bacterium]|nr:hypothetical protein [Gammaproteobacteria bacterium]
MSKRIDVLSITFLGLLLAVAGCGDGGSNRLPVPPPAAPPQGIILNGIVSDGPVEDGWIYLFAAANVNDALSAANAAEDRLEALNDAGPLAVFNRDPADEDSFEISVPGERAGEVVFVIFEGTDAIDQEFGDAPANLESVVILGAAGTTQRVNLSLHATLISQRVRAGLTTPVDVAAVETDIATAEMNVLDALGEGPDGEVLYPDGESPLDTEDDEVVHAASSLIGLLARTIAAVEGVSLDEVVAALAMDAADGDIDGDVPMPFDPSEAQQELVDAAAEILSRGQDEEVLMMASGPCSSTAVTLWQACDIDVLDDFFEGRAICADVSDEDDRVECIAEVEAEAEETEAECDEVFEARIALCADLDDAPHEPAFGEAFAANFVDPLEIGNSVEPNPYLPLVPGTEWVYESTFIDEDDGEEVTETTTVVVTEATKLIQGITCVVVNDVVEEDGEVIEDTDDWFAQDLDGNVWYCGEIARDFEYFEGDEPEVGELVSIEGSWKSGREGAKAGILVPADPEVGDVIRNEVLYGEAEDVIEVLNLAAGESVPAADCDGMCLVLAETTPLEPDANESTYYKPGVGVILEVDEETGDRAELISFSPGGGPSLSAAKLLIEHNATDEDTGFQGFGDGDPYNELTITGPGDVLIVTVTALGGLFDFGLTELFFETSEPENAEVPIVDVLNRLEEGTYIYRGELVDGEEDMLTATFTHDIPAGPELVSPVDGAAGVNPASTVVSWNAVTLDLDGEDITIVGYQVIVEEEVEAAFPLGFAKPVFSVYLPASATSVSVPAAFMIDDACYAWEVLAIEESGNQTLSSAEFETGGGCTPTAGVDPEGLKDGKILIEHNATDEDTGFQGFIDGDPWDRMTITDPGGVDIATVTPAGGLFNFGLTELFFETSEPLNEEVPIFDVLARLPEGTYTFTGLLVESGEESTFETMLTHNIPVGPMLTSPVDGDETVDPQDTVVSWDPVTTDLDGDAITIVGYQVIVEEDEDPEFTDGFAQPVFSVYLPASATSVVVPAEFMRPDTDYAYEVLAIEESGNQTLSSAEFATAAEE